MKFILATLLLFSVTALNAQETRLPESLVGPIEQLVTAKMETTGIPGMSVAIARQNSLAYSRGFGQSDVENSVPAKADTRYRTASIAKSMTAVVAMSLAENKQLDLDKPVRAYCSAWPEKQWPLTARQLLGHLAGVRHYKSRQETVQTLHYTSLTDALATFQDDPLRHEPGSKYLYSTFGYNLIGCVVEAASKKDFESLLQERVLTPAGMRHTVVDNHFAIVPDRTRGYTRINRSAGQPGRLVNASLHDTSVKIPAGGLLSTAPDLIRFAVAVNTGKLLKDATRTEMWAEQQTASGQKTSYGLGWQIRQFRSMQVVAHTGGQAGTSTILILVPQHGTAVALMCNLQNAGLRELANEIAGTLHPQTEEPGPCAR